MVAAVVYGVLYIYQLFTNTEVYNCHNVLYHKDTKISVYFFPLQKKNGQKLYSLCPILSHLQLGGEKCLLFTSKLANQGVRKALFISVVSTNTYDTAYAHVFRPLLSPLLHLNASLSGAEWSGQASVVQSPPLPSPPLPNAFDTRQSSIHGDFV